MFIDEIKDDQQQNQFYTNNPDDAVYTNNPDDEENMNKNNNKLFFDDNNNDDNNDTLGQKLIEDENDDNPFLDKNDIIIKKDISENKNNNCDKKEEIKNLELSENNDVIDEEKEEEKKVKIEIDLIQKETNDIKINKEEDILIKEDKNKNNNELKLNAKKDNINKKQPKRVLKQSNESNNENDSIAESLIRPNPDNSQNEEKDNKNIKKILLSIFFGQLLALLSVGNGFFAEEIQNNKNEEKKIVTPLLMNSTYYFLIFLIYFFISKCKIKKPRLIYIILSLLDTQSNFINIFLFSIIPFDYPYIMNILSTIWTVVFTLILIRTYKYLKNHIFGIILCFIGVVGMILGTFNSIEDLKDKFKDFNDNITGLLLSLLASIFYGLSAVLMEKYISSENGEIKSYCTWLGIFGFFISALEAFIPKGDYSFEYKILFSEKIDEIDTKIIIFWILSAICLAAMTSLSPLYIQKFQATMFNISLVFTIFWSFIIKSIFIRDEPFEWHWFNILYFIGFIIIISGTVIFFLKDRVRRNDFAYA